MTKQVQRLFDIEYKARERGRKALRGKPMKQRAPMKPIPGWIKFDFDGEPIEVSLYRSTFRICGNQRVRPVEIRERPTKTYDIRPEDARILRLSILRAVDWSDVDDNSKAHGPEWTKNERRLISRLSALRRRLEQWLDRVDRERPKPQRAAKEKR